MAAADSSRHKAADALQVTTRLFQRATSRRQKPPTASRWHEGTTRARRVSRERLSHPEIAPFVPVAPCATCPPPLPIAPHLSTSGTPRPTVRFHTVPPSPPRLRQAVGKLEAKQLRPRRAATSVRAPSTLHPDSSPPAAAARRRGARGSRSATPPRAGRSELVARPARRGGKQMCAVAAYGQRASWE